MLDAGLAILESFDAEIYENSFTNVKYGIRISLGGGNNDVHDNVFDTCSDCKTGIVSPLARVCKRIHVHGVLYDSREDTRVLDFI